MTISGGGGTLAGGGGGNPGAPLPLYETLYSISNCRAGSEATNRAAMSFLTLGIVRVRMAGNMNYRRGWAASNGRAGASGPRPKLGHSYRLASETWGKAKAGAQLQFQPG